LGLFTKIYLLYSVSDLTGPSSGASFKLDEWIGKWYYTYCLMIPAVMVLFEELRSSYNTVTAGNIEQYV
jgi:hypothetical protein